MPRKKLTYKSIRRDVFGAGSSLRNALNGGNHARLKRHLSWSCWTHVSMRSAQAKGNWSLGRNRNRIYNLIVAKGREYGVLVRQCVVMGNHIHIVMKAKDRACYKRWIRAVSGLIARMATGAERGKKLLKQPFWSTRPFTRIIRGFQELRTMTRYILKNEIERTAPPSVDQEAIRMIAESFLRLEEIELQESS